MCSPTGEHCQQKNLTNTLVAKGLKGHLVVISNTLNLMFSVVSNAAYGSYEMFPVGS